MFCLKAINEIEGDFLAYCVNCGVELAPGEPRCPLCGIVSVNPLEEQQTDAARPYPSHVERLNKRIDRRYTAMFLSLLLFIPLFVCAFCDLLFCGGLSWSVYVLGGLGLVFVWFLLPFFFRRRRLLKILLSDGLAAAGMLLLIERMSGGNWFLRLGLPLAVIGTAFAYLLLSMLRADLPLSPFKRAGIALFGAGFVPVLIEGALMLYRGALTLPRWSPYAFFPCAVLGACLFLLDKRAALKEQLERRFFV